MRAAALLALAPLALAACVDPYTAPPLSGETMAIVSVVPQTKLASLCRWRAAAACETDVGGAHFIYLPLEAVNADDPAVATLLHHELAHAAGWDHPAWPGQEGK